MGQRRRWLPPLSLIPVLYGLGWLTVQPLKLLWPDLAEESLALPGTLTSFLLFVLILPSWVKLRWAESKPWQALGLSRRQGLQGRTGVLALSKGLTWAFALLVLVVVPVLLGSWGHWLADISLSESLNAVLLGLGVGLAEELIFRGWLWGELDRLFSARSGLLLQAAVFSLVHTRFNLGFWPMLALLIGLFLLGVALAVRRRLDRGSLWGSIGLHGGLVGGWFALQSGLIQLSPDAPAWLVGPGGISPNPVGGIVAILALSALLWRQLAALEIPGRPDLTGARSASSRGAKP
ncbi:MAG: lysostaphin resistance A-like protein [Prochlorococcus sp.]|nr:type II CAAX endopeptidase family protein [Prochlorococcaceae cyanobacterium Fu_MAG_50]